MPRNLLLILLLACLTFFAPSRAVGQDESGSVTYTFGDGAVPSALEQAVKSGRWVVQDNRFTNADDEKVDSFSLPESASDQVHVELEAHALSINEKGGFWGVALRLDDGTRVQVIIQNHQFRYYLQKPGEGIKPQTFAPLPGSAEDTVFFKLDVEDGKLTATTGDKSHDLDLPAKRVVGVEFQAYQARVGIERITFDLTGSGDAASSATQHEPIQSQLAAGDELMPPADPDALVILFIGDSITRHGFNERTVQKLGWGHVAGMAASEEANDYAHRFASDVGAMHPDRKVVPYFHERGGSGKVRERLTTLDAFASLAPGIVVVQLGEHEKQEQGAAQHQTDYRKLLSTLQQWDPKPAILCVGVWDPYGKGQRTSYQGWTDQVDQTMADVCDSLGIPYARMAEHALNPANSGWGTSHGVQWHPNDAGMARYAEELLAMYRRIVSDEPS